MCTGSKASSSGSVLNVVIFSQLIKEVEVERKDFMIGYGRSIDNDSKTDGL